MSIKNVLTIAGADSGGGAGIQADLKTFAAHDVFGLSVITALTAQNTMGVQGIHRAPVDFVKQQLESVFQDIHIDAVKIGMAGECDTIHVIAEILKHYKPPYIVLDPVMVATSGDVLLADNAITALQDCLVPLASLVTPNAHEFEILGEMPAPTLIKGGHKDGKQAIDILMIDGEETPFSAPRIPSNNTHGTGCTLSSAITANLAKGYDMKIAVQAAKHYVTQAILHSDHLNVGQGAGPLHHGWKR